MKQQNLVQEVAKANNIEPEDIASVTISTTPDINSAFPAKSVRLMEGWQYVPIMCMHEMDVPGALPLMYSCINTCKYRLYHSKKFIIFI